MTHLAMALLRPEAQIVHVSRMGAGCLTSLVYPAYPLIILTKAAYQHNRSNQCAAADDSSHSDKSKTLRDAFVYFIQHGKKT